MRMIFSQSARKHRIAKGRARYVISNTTPLAEYDDNGNLVALEWIGPDDRGVELHIIGIVKTDNRSATGEQIVLINHVFPTALKEKRHE